MNDNTNSGEDGPTDDVSDDERPRDADTGRWVSTFDREDVLEVVRDQDGVTSGDIVDAFDTSYDTARRRLNELYELGCVNRRKIATGYFYTLSDTDMDCGGGGDR